MRCRPPCYAALLSLLLLLLLPRTTFAQAGGACAGVYLDETQGRLGAYVVSVVPGSPADEAGVQAADVVVSAAGRTIQTVADFSAALAGRRPGDVISVSLLRPPTHAMLSGSITLGQTSGGGCVTYSPVTATPARTPTSYRTATPRPTWTPRPTATPYPSPTPWRSPTPLPTTAAPFGLSFRGLFRGFAIPATYEGMTELVSVRVVLENYGSAGIAVERYHFGLLDNEGRNHRAAYFIGTQSPASDELDRIPRLSPGGAATITVSFEFHPSLRPVRLNFAPAWDTALSVDLTDKPSQTWPPTATPTGTPTTSPTSTRRPTATPFPAVGQVAASPVPAATAGPRRAPQPGSSPPSSSTSAARPTATPAVPPAPEYEIEPTGNIRVGYFYSQAAGGRGGYSLTNAFWELVQLLGGVETVGYPASRRWQGADGILYQVTQGALLQWEESTGATLGNTFELLEAAGRDDWLQSLGIPRPIKNDGSSSYQEAVQIRLGWLTQAQIAQRYWSAGSVATELYGLPMSQPERFGPFVAQRLQRIAFQLWVDSVPDRPPPGSVSTVLGGDLLKEAGLVPAEAQPPELPPARRAPPTPTATAVPRREPAPAATRPPAPMPRTSTIGRALDIIFNADTGRLRELATTLVHHDVTIEFGPRPVGSIAVWQPRQSRITIADRYRSSSAEGLAGVLVHEATHALDAFRGRDTGPGLDCYDWELRAFQNQARFWEQLYGAGGKPGATDPLEQWMNNILFQVNEEPATFVLLNLLELYEHQCQP